jgi:hypothetical protein
VALSFHLVSASGAALQPNAILLLTYVAPNGIERVVRETIPMTGAVSLEPEKDGATLLRVRAFAPPFILIFDENFPPGHVWPEQVTITVRDVRTSTETPAQHSLINQRQLFVTPRSGSQLPQIAGLRNGGGQGLPSLPVEVHRVLIPPSQRVTAVHPIEDPEPVRVAAPQPVLRPTLVRDVPNPRRVEARPVSLPLTRPLPARFPTETVQLNRVDAHDWGTMATVQLWPVQYDAATKEFVHHRNLRYDFVTEPATAPGTVLFPDVHGRDRALTLLSLMKNESVIVSPGALKPGLWLIDPQALISNEPAGTVIITDDTAWNGTSSNPPFLNATTITQGAPVAKNPSGNGMIAEFERLAYWKTSRGMRTKVVPISIIMSFYKAGDLQTFLPGPALDLPEVIRAFIGYAQKNWQTNYVLLGGVPDIVPMRQLLASRGSDFARNASGPPSATILEVSPGHLIAKLAGTDGTAFDLADNRCNVDGSFSLIGVNSGIVIPFSKDGGGPRGWYFTNSSDFANKTFGFTILASTSDPKAALYVIAFGGPELQDDFAWVWPGRASETDHYYSDMTRAPVGQHDFDANGNLLLGQTAPNGDDDISLDGMQITGSVYVGRAPVANATEAKNFVDKVLAYETLVTPEGSALDASYLHKLTLYADNWAHPWLFAQYPAPAGKTVPDPGNYLWSGSDVLVRIEDDEGLASALAQNAVSATPAFSLQALYDASGEVTTIPYDSSGKSGTCWFFCSQQFNRLDPASDAKGTSFVRIANAPPDFDTLFWQNPIIDYGSAQKERIHSDFKNLFRGLGDLRRTYRDNVDFPDQDIEPILDETANSVLDDGVHFLSVTGHGNVNNVGSIRERACLNAKKPFIMYAHSCLTADPQARPNLGSHFVTQPNGALAYIGYARSCWTGDPVADYEAGFWCGVAEFRRLGPPVSLHMNTSNWQQFAHIFMMMLYGDPEMPVWTRPPRTLSVAFTYNQVSSGLFKGAELVQVTATDNSQAVQGVTVTLLQGWTNSLTDPKYFTSTTTDDNGKAWVLFSQPRNSLARIVVASPVISSDVQYVPVIKDYAPGTTG